jgi:hypothetical protein
MQILCLCGMDCSEFVDQHSIPSAATFACPGCDGQLIARASGNDIMPPDLVEVGAGGNEAGANR